MHVPVLLVSEHFRYDATTSPLELFGISVKQEEMGNTKQLTKHEHLTTERSDKMAVKSSDTRYVLCSCNSETGTNSKKVY